MVCKVIMNIFAETILQCVAYKRFLELSRKKTKSSIVRKLVPNQKLPSMPVFSEKLPSSSVCVVRAASCSQAS